MITELAVVTKVEKQQVWVESSRSSGCSGCLQNSSCGTSALDKWIKKRSLAVDSEITVIAGDQVEVAIEEAVLLKASVLIYLVPLLMMLMGAGCAQWLLPKETALVDIWVAFTALMTLAVGLWLIHQFQASYLVHFFPRPVVVRKIS
ncbi:MAG: SoxR reducing system RseC family protein [Methylococcaceae bacterium]